VAADTSVIKALRARPDFEQMIQILQGQGVLVKGDDPEVFRVAV
jgi:hypothetical protein